MHDGHVWFQHWPHCLNQAEHPGVGFWWPVADVVALPGTGRSSRVPSKHAPYMKKNQKHQKHAKEG